MQKPANARAPESGTSTYSIWQLLGLLAGPLLFLFIYFLVRPDGMPVPATAVLASAAWAAAWWLTRAVPVFVSSLLPLVLFPVLGIASIPEAAAAYAAPTVWLILGGALIALALERWNLYRRMALSLMRLPGAGPARLAAGFLIASACLSIWLPATATALIMLPIGLAVIAQRQQPHYSHKVIAIGGGAPGTNFGTALVLSIAYGAAFGRLGLLGAVPIIACGALLLWKGFPPDRGLTRQEPSATGRVSAPDIWVLILAATVLAMWIAVPYLPLRLDYATVAMAGGLLLFVIPTDLSRNQWLLTTEALSKVPWSLLLLPGAGLSVAGAARSSGLLNWIAVPPVAAQIGTATLSLIAIAAVATAFVKDQVSVRQMVKTGFWLSVAGSAVIALSAYLN